MVHMEQSSWWGFSASQKRELWERWRRGQSSNDIARALGKLRGSIYKVLASSGGIAPAPRRRSRLALRLAQREEISRGLAEGQSMRAIAAALQRAPPTVSRPQWSPEQISGWLTRRYPGDTGMHISHENIFRSHFLQARA